MKQAAIHQPYFFPYLGYFALIASSDVFIVFDTPQMIRHGWVERNRVMFPDGHVNYIKVPLLKYEQNTAIKDVLIDNEQDWIVKLLAQLNHYKRKAPYYYKVVGLLEESLFLNNSWNNLAVLNSYCLKEICRYLGISTPFYTFSRLDLKLPEIMEPDEWALEICRSIGADKYVNAPGGLNFFDRAKYRNAGIDLKFLKVELAQYRQFNGAAFQPGLSIIDVMMWNSPQEIRTMLNKYELL